MNFIKWDLGTLSRGDAVTFQLSGVESDVMLMTPSDLSAFKSRRGFSYVGGHTRKPVVTLGVPNSGTWHAVVVPGLGGTVKAQVSVTRG
jgi:hypothetical protein